MTTKKSWSFKNLVVTLVCAFMLTFGGVQLALADVPTVSDPNFAPLRSVAESIGAQVEWVGETRTIAIAHKGDYIEISIDTGEYTINGIKKSIYPPLQIIDDRTMVPTNFIAQELHAVVTYDAGMMKIDYCGNKKEIPVVQVVHTPDRNREILYSLNTVIPSGKVEVLEYNGKERFYVRSNDGELLFKVSINSIGWDFYITAFEPAGIEMVKKVVSAICPAEQAGKIIEEYDRILNGIPLVRPPLDNIRAAYGNYKNGQSDVSIDFLE